MFIKGGENAVGRAKIFPIVDENDETRQATIAREMSDDSTIEM